MQNIQKYLDAFRELFSLENSNTHRQGWSWIRLIANEFGLLRLQRGEQYEGIEAELMWFKDELVAMDGLDFNLAVLLVVAEKLGLPTDHPCLESIRKTAEYQEMNRTGRLILE